MRRSTPAMVVVLGIWLAALAVSFVAGTRHLSADIGPCEFTCICKNVKAYKPGPATNPILIYKIVGGNPVITTDAVTMITTIDGCDASTPTATTETIYKLSGNWDAICLIAVPDPGQNPIDREYVPPQVVLFPPEPPGGSTRYVCAPP